MMLSQKQPAWRLMPSQLCRAHPSQTPNPTAISGLLPGSWVVGEN